ncbi:MAG: hypothetical protein K2Y12_11345 [Chitinophagaceae bacterium]|nr:hypothetical protein [Chitinophagaceae bacterium]
MKQILFLAFCMFVAFAASAQQDSSATAILGKYKFPEGSIVPEATVTNENGTIIMTTSAGSSELAKQNDDVYTIVAFQGTAAFKRNDAKKVIGVVIDAMGYHLEGTKEQAAAAWIRFSDQKRLYRK